MTSSHIKPSLARMVIYKVAASEVAVNNHSEVAPATIVRVWNDNMVNLKVFTDATGEWWKTSVPYAGDDASAESAPEFSWFWPPKV